MWAWAALLGGLAVVIAADLVSGPPRSERRDVGRAGSETLLDTREQRAAALARNFTSWHQAAIQTVRSDPRPAVEIEIAEGRIRAALPGYYVKAGPWRSSFAANGTVRTSDDGAAIAGIAVGGGTLGRFVAAATGYAGLGGLQVGTAVATTLVDFADGINTTPALTGHVVRTNLPDTAPDQQDLNVLPP